MNYLWEIPELWPGSTVFIIGGGPSLLQMDLSLIQDKRVIGVNQAYKLGSWIDVCWYGDKQWYVSQLPQIKEFKGLIITCSSEAQERRRHKQVRYVGRSKQRGLEYGRRTHIGWNGNSGASAINVAYWLGARRVVLLGFDMRLPDDKKNGRTHWHDDYERKINKSTNLLVDCYSRYMKAWPAIKSDAEKINLEIINASPNSAITLFPFKPLEELI